MIHRPKVGVVVPARNALRTIECLLETVAAQTYECHAYIADDASDDGMRKFLEDRPTWYAQYQYFGERGGWPTSTNRAARMALADGCDVIQIAAADDFLRLDCIQRGVDAIYGRDFVIPLSQQVGEEDVVQRSAEHQTLRDFRDWCPLIDKAMIRKNVWEKVGGYSTDITVPERPWGCAEDWEFWIKVFKEGFTNYTVVQYPTYYYRMHPGQLGRGRQEVHDKTVAVIRRKHPDVWRAQ